VACGSDANGVAAASAPGAGGSSHSARAPGRARPCTRRIFTGGARLTRSVERAERAAVERAASPETRRAGSSSIRSIPRPRRGTRRTERCSATTPWPLRSRGASPAFCSSNRTSWSSSYHSIGTTAFLIGRLGGSPELPPTRTPGWRAPGIGDPPFLPRRPKPGCPYTSLLDVSKDTRDARAAHRTKGVFSRHNPAPLGYNFCCREAGNAMDSGQWIIDNKKPMLSGRDALECLFFQ